MKIANLEIRENAYYWSVTDGDGSPVAGGWAKRRRDAESDMNLWLEGYEAVGELMVHLHETRFYYGQWSGTWSGSEPTRFDWDSEDQPENWEDLLDQLMRVI